MEVFLIRHTSPEIEKGVCYGQTDLAIVESTFLEESKKIKSKLPNDITTFYSSPLKRCRKLVEKLTQNYQTDERLMEMNFGLWENQKWDAINAVELNAWMEDFVTFQPPKGENYQIVYQRNVAFITELLEKPQQKIAIVTHAGNIRSILSYVLGLSLKNSFRIALQYGAVVHVSIHEDSCLNQLHSIQ